MRTRDASITRRRYEYITQALEATAAALDMKVEDVTNGLKLGGIEDDFQVEVVGNLFSELLERYRVWALKVMETQVLNQKTREIVILTGAQFVDTMLQNEMKKD